jgi:hypothetical protein
MILPMQNRIFLALVGVFLLFLRGLQAHEINSNKLTLIMREKNHISLVFQINLIKAMNQVIAPQTGNGDFVLGLSGADPKIFQKAYDKTKTKIFNGIQITTKDQSKLVVKDWKWPDAKTIQNQFQSQIMEIMTGTHDHTKEPLVEINAELVSKLDLSEIKIQVLPEIQPILFISYKPSLLWSNLSKPSEIQF